VTDARLLAEDARQLLDELDRGLPGAAMSSGECRPTLDIIETADAAEVIVDVPGVPLGALRVAIRHNTVLVVGAKLTVPPPGEARFHLAERSYGRFARAVRVAGAFDAGRSRAVVADGLLRVILPRIDDRRGHLVNLAVETA
jgi:HSP20 family protein